MKRLFWLFFLLRLVYAAVPQSFTVKAGRYTAGKFQSVLAQNIVVTVSGTQTATTDRRDHGGMRRYGPYWIDLAHAERSDGQITTGRGLG
jgi:hypothetical protein